MADNMILEKDKNYTMNMFDGFIYNPTTKSLMARCDALDTSGLTIATELTEKRGGPNNDIIFSIPSNKTLTVSLSNIVFDETWLSIQTGEKWSMGEFDIYGCTASCQVTESAGVRTIELPETPIGSEINIASGAGYIQVPITAGNKTVDVTTITGDANKCLEVVYATKAKSRQLEMHGATAPTVIMLVLAKKIRKGKGGDPVSVLTVTLPNFQPDGNLELSGTAGDSDSMTMNGTAQSTLSTECGSTDTTIGTFNIRDIDPNAVKAIAISTASTYEIDASGMDNIQVWASKGSDLVYEPFDVTDECEYASDDDTVVTVDNAGTIMGVSTGTAIITIKYGNLTATTEVTVI